MEASTVEPAGGRVPPVRVRAAAAPPAGPSGYAAELLGTFTLVLFIAFAFTLFAPGDEGGLNYTDYTLLGLVHLLVLMVLVYSLAGTSGAHFNPAVTIALLARGKVAPGDAPIYIAVQLIGAILAALLVNALLGDAADAVNVGATGVAEGRLLEGSVGRGLIVEFIGTFVLVWAYMATTADPRGNRAWAGLAIGGALGLAALVFAPMTGGGFNPARAFGPGLVGEFTGGFGDFLLAFTLGPILGALAAAFAYAAIVQGPRDRAEGGGGEADPGLR